MKIGIYVLTKYAKQTYSKECYNVRINAGMSVVADIIRRAGFDDIEYASQATAHRYDVVLFSVTSDCDMWDFIAERIKWERGSYKVCIGGAGVLNVRPFLPYVDYFMFGRAEGVVDNLMNALAAGDDFESPYVVNSKTFSPDRLYYIKQVDESYPHDLHLENGKTYHEDTIGCNHKCLFCGYTWHRKQAKQEAFHYNWIWSGSEDSERAMIDMHNGVDVDLVKLRTTAIDGFSQRLRFYVNKKITREMLREFLDRLARCEKPHQVKFFNIVGYPTETVDDWMEFLDDLQTVDAHLPFQSKQTCVLLHSTPFRPMPATPLACAPMQYRNFRGEIARTLGGGRYKGNIFYQGNAMWGVESMGTESLPTVIQSAIVWRGTEQDSDNFAKVAASRRFRTANTAVKQATLEKYFDVDRLFGAYTAETLPTRYLRTYAKVEKMWPHDLTT